MKPLVIVLCPAPAPALASALPMCLHPILEDPCLLWLLRTLEEGAASIRIAHAGPAVAGAVAAWQKAGLCRGNLTCLEGAESAQAEALLTMALDGIPEHQPVHTVWGHGLPLDPEAFRASLASHHRGIPGPNQPGTFALESRRDLALAQAEARRRIQEAWMDAGVSFEDPASTTVGPRVHLSPDVTLDRGVHLSGSVTVGTGARIGQGCVIRDTTIGAGAEFRPYCVAQGGTLGQGVKIGPFAHIREGSVLEDDVHMGNFVETKKTILRKGAKANHLTYLGDAEVGEKTNIGAGCITCNYDGVNKHRTVIGRDVFVGSDCQLVAPVTLGDGCMIAAGTTVTQDVPAEAMAISRATFTVREGGAARFRAKLPPRVR